MPTYKVISPNGITFEPNGPGSAVTVPHGETFELEDRLTYLIGTQIGAQQVRLIEAAKQADDFSEPAPAEEVATPILEEPVEAPAEEVVEAPKRGRSAKK